MTHPNAELLRTAYDAFGSGDLHAYSDGGHHRFWSQRNRAASDH
jgi:hypothetical protein